MSIQRIRYDFTYLEDACDRLLISGVSKNNKNIFNLKTEINKFFKDSHCEDIILTKSDSMFFGMCVYPIMTKDLINDILSNPDSKIRFKKYIIEIDTKLFDPVLDLSKEEFLAILLHEIGHIVNDPQPIEDLRNTINLTLAKTNNTLNIPKAIQYYQILSFGFKNTIHKTTSMFYIYKNGEYLADEFVYMCGYDKHLNSAFTKICRHGLYINDNVNKLVAMTWTLSLYKDVKLKRIPAIRLLDKMKVITASKLEAKEMEIVINALKNIDDQSLEESCSYDNDEINYVLEANGKLIKTKYAELRKKTTAKQIRPFEDDLYEYTMRIRHISTEEDALYLIRQINLRISVIEEYLEKERLSEYEYNKWFHILDNYNKLRDQMSSNTNYRYDYSGSVIQVNYPDIVQDRI